MGKFKTKIDRLKHRYNLAKKANVGDETMCPWCGNKFIKTTYHKTFCSNYKTKGRNNCKDNFWNMVDPEKRCRHTQYFEDVILEDYAKSMGFPSYADLLDTELNDDPSWDAHGGVEIAICEFCNLRVDYCQCGSNQYYMP